MKRRGIGGFGSRNSVHAFENGFHALERCARHSEHVTRLQRVGFFDFFPVLASSPLLNHFDAEFFIFQVGLHPLEKAFHEPLGDVSLSVDEAFSGDHGSGNVGLVDLGHIE